MVLGLFATARPAQAQDQRYLSALSYLRTARDYIQYDKNQFGPERRHAVDEINKALDEIKHAAWDDGIQTRFAPPAQGVTTGWSPMHQAQHFLHMAKGEIALTVDTPQTPGVRDRSIHHIDEAQITIDRLVAAGGQ
jgi:hypothetical protein